jgi:hypothetical protein
MDSVPFQKHWAIFAFKGSFLKKEEINNNRKVLKRN